MLRFLTIAGALGAGWLLTACGADAVATSDAQAGDDVQTAAVDSEQPDAATADTADTPDAAATVDAAAAVDATAADDGHADALPCEPGKTACEPAGALKDQCRGARQCVATGDASAPYACLTDPAVAKVCDAGLDTVCAVSACDPADGKCSLIAVERAVDVCDLPDGECRRVRRAANDPDGAPTACDDGLPCSVAPTCKAGGCVADLSHCACKHDSDCADDGDLCNGFQRCDKAGSEWTCKLAPGSAITCNTAGDTACLQTQCRPQDGSCLPTALPTTATCTDGVACSVADHCDGEGACASGPWSCCSDDKDCAS